MRDRSTLVLVLVVAGVVAYTSGPVNRIRSWWEFDLPLADDPAIIAVYAALGVIGVAALVARLDEVPRLLLVVAGALAAWLVVSTAWSSDRAVTARESLMIAGTLAAGIAAAAWLPLRRLALALWAGLHVGLAWSFLAIQLDQPNTLDNRSNWAGIFFNRNTLALYAALGILMSLLLAAEAIVTRATERDWWGAVVLVMLAATLADVRLVAGAGAATPLGALAAAAIAVGLAVASRRAVRARVVTAERVTAVGGALFVAVVVGGYLTRSAWLERLGRDADLTDRADLWGVAWDWAMRRPLSGYGYLGAWDERPFVRAVRRATEKRSLTSTHNSFLEVQLGTGLLGALALLALVGTVFWLTARAAVRGRDVLSTAPFALVVFAIVENLTETLLVGNHLLVALLTGSGVAAWRFDAVRSPGDDVPGAAAPGDLDGGEPGVGGRVRPTVEEHVPSGGIGDPPAGRIVPEV